MCIGNVDIDQRQEHFSTTNAHKIVLFFDPPQQCLSRRFGGARELKCRRQNHRSKVGADRDGQAGHVQELTLLRVMALLKILTIERKDVSACARAHVLSDGVAHLVLSQA